MRGEWRPNVTERVKVPLTYPSDCLTNRDHLISPADGARGGAHEPQQLL